MKGHTDQIYLSKNVSRVKQRLEVGEKGARGHGGQRNNSQLQSRTNESKGHGPVLANMTNHQKVIEKLNLRSSSKPRANEKTTATDDDDYDNECNSGAPPSPVVEENERRRRS